MNLIIVMPVYNEEEVLENVVKNWLSLAKNIPESFLLVVNDGSTDKTALILNRLSVQYQQLKPIHKKNGGHGSAVLEGYKYALSLNPDWIFQVDSDDQIPASEFGKLWDKRNQSDFVLGRRYYRQDPLSRIIISKLNRILIFLLFGVIVKDPNIPFRLMRSELLSIYLKNLPSNPFAPNIFLSILARTRGVDTLDIPVVHRIRSTGTPSIRWNRLFSICTRVSREMILFRLKIFAQPA